MRPYNRPEMIHRSRLRTLSEHDSHAGQYVLYWMQASQRARFNHALEYAIQQANELDLPLLVAFGLMDDYPEANARHYAFMLQGLADVHARLQERGIQFVLRHGNPADVAIKLAADAALLVCDRGYTRHQKAWRDRVADESKRRVIEVESDVVVPVETVSDKQEYAARTIRPKVQRHLKTYLVPLKEAKPVRSSLDLGVHGDFDPSLPERTLARLKLERSVGPVTAFVGGEAEAQRRLRHFVRAKLNGYAEGRNEPADAQSSHLSPYLHFGQISPVEIALAAMGADTGAAVDKESFVEELIVRRELSMNYVNFCPDYDRYAASPAWARRSLEKHAADPRPYLYTPEHLEAAQTHDRWWNAAQTEMSRTGFMHNYLRMYWGKKILEWTRDPAEAFETTLRLNNKLFLDGRDPNSYAGVAWIYGQHDRPWGPERPIFGLVRYMNSAGLERKFDMKAYERRVLGAPSLFE